MRRYVTSQKVNLFLAASFAVVLFSSFTYVKAQENKDTPETAVNNQPAAEDIEFFEAEVLPLLKRNCYSCHSHESGKSKGGLVVDSQTGLLTGGESGPALKSGDPTASLLIRAIRGDDAEVSQMPPDNKLSDAEIETLVRWVSRGAVDTRQPTQAIAPMEEIIAQSKSHWSFQPITKPEVPASTSVKSVNPIDRFIAHRLSSQELTMAPQAPARVLIRRAYFDLIGLPPTIEEVARFENRFEENPQQAMEQLVDGLLDSPHYGERWARHWMDAARYSDVSGGMRNQGRDDRLPFAFTYRDYLIRAFNNDKPYDQFILEQLAADQISLADKRDLAATAFLAIGSVAGTEEERIAERIDTVMQTFQGLTVGCARCHDHKFDPIPTEDYYALRGVIASSKELGTGARAERVDNDLCPIIAECDNEDLRQQYEREVVNAERELREYEDKVWLPKEEQWRKQTGEYLDVLAMTAKDRGGLSPQDFVRSRLDRSVLQAWSQLVTRAARRFDPVFEPWVAFSKLKSERFAEQFDKTLQSLTEGDKKKRVNPLLLSAIENAKPQSMRDVAKVYSDLFAKADREWNLLLAEATTKNNQSPTELPDADLDSFRRLLYEPGMPAARAENKVREAFGNNDRKRSDLIKKLQDAKFHHPGSPIRAMGVIDSDDIGDSPIFVRGEPDQATKERVPRRYVSVIAGENPTSFSTGAGRLDWAKAIVDPTNPLTARVMVNRVWMYHFGKGLVSSTGDFGLQTPQPQQAELLDWLAATFMEEGWSIKKLHRHILLSKTWQQSSTEHEQYNRAMEKDPENTLLWRQNVRRLEFEPMRDAILAVTGKLDPTLYGRSLPSLTDVKNTRRTIYAFIDRTATPTILSTFDVPNPNLTQGERFVSTVSPQALFLMNNPFVSLNVRELARSEEFKSLPEDHTTRIQWIYRRVLQREASPSEIDALLKLLPTKPIVEAAPVDPKAAELAEAIAKAEKALSDNGKDKAARRRLDQLRKQEQARKAAEARKARQAMEREKIAVPTANGWEKIIHTLLLCNEFVYVL